MPSNLLLFPLLQLHLPNHSLRTVSIMNVQLPILHLHLSIVATRRKPITIITPLRRNGLQTLNSPPSRTLNFLPFRRYNLMPPQHTDISILEIIQNAGTEITGIIKININLITYLDKNRSNTFIKTVAAVWCFPVIDGWGCKGLIWMVEGLSFC